ncbi:MAG TPA: SpoVR family protein [Pyrinomonadaceae bacterium]|jgi:stage V sporulation protein R
MQDKEVQELEKALEQIWEIAQKMGLDPFPTKFEIVPATVMYEVGSYALPGRYSHWTFGKAYHRMKTMYDFGLSKIYEVVINTNPSYAFLLETNSLLQNKLVIAHVLGHTDFFKNNAWFSKTDRRMVDTVSSHTSRMQEYEFKYGRKKVEQLLDSVLSIEEHIDPNFFIRRKNKDEKQEPLEKREGRYDDLFALDKPDPEKEPEDEIERAVQHDLQLIMEMFDDPKPGNLGEKDLVHFIMRNSPVLEPWQRDVIAMIHEEMEYFVPQMMTKTMNEGWACAVASTLLPTDRGFLRFDDLYKNGKKIRVASGGRNELNRITDFHKEENVPTIRICTRRGYEIEGALKHRLRLANGDWAYLKDVNIGDKVSLARGTNVWAIETPAFNFTASQPSVSLKEIAGLSGVSPLTVSRHRAGQLAKNGAIIEQMLTVKNYEAGARIKIQATRKLLNISKNLTEDVAWFLGYFVGDGNRTKSGIGITTGDDEIKDKLAGIVDDFFGLQAKVKWDATETKGRWRVVVHSREIWRWLDSVGINLEDKARNKKIPNSILRSPKNIISAFLRGYFDADAYAGKEGVRLSSASKELIKTVQIILLNYGILSRQREHLSGVWQLEIAGTSAQSFLNEIGFSLERKQSALREHVENRQWFRKEETDDEIVEIEHRTNDVYDITVAEKHAYVANGFVNHNSFWHSRIMRELDLPDSEHLEFADLHSSVVSPHHGQLNPYYVGYKIFEDLENRYGRDKIFEVRELDNDVSFLRNYLTKELCEELDLFVFELVEEEEWTITEKKWEKVRDALVANMTNFGFPYIVVADGDYNGNRELYLKHLYEGSELDERYAQKTLEHVYRLWGRPVHLETIVDEEKTVLRYDGENHEEG